MNFQVTSFQWPHFTDSQIIFPSGIDIIAQLPPFSIFNYHFTDWHLWTFVNMFCLLFFSWWHKHISKQSGKSIRWTVQRHHSGSQQWDKLDRKKCAGIIYLDITWWRPAGEKSMIVLARELTSKSQMVVQNMWLAMCTNQINMHVCSHMYIWCVLLIWVCVFIYMCWIPMYMCMCVCGRQEGILAIMKHLTHNFQ